MLDLMVGPPGLILLGSILGAVGALWAAQQQTRFEGQLRVKSEKIAELSSETLAAVTGGDGYCYVSILVDGNKGRWMFIREGKHALYDVTARFVDLDKLDEIEGQISLDTLEYSNTVMNLGTLIAGHASIKGEFELDKFPTQGLNVFFAARNGGFCQDLRLARTANGWKQAIRVMRQDEVLLEKVDDEFPRTADGAVRW